MAEILVGFDASPGARVAFRWAAAAAKARGDSLRLVRSWHYPADTPLPWARQALPSVDEMDRTIRSETEEMLASELGPDTATVDVTIAHGPAATALRSAAAGASGERAARGAADVAMLVLGSRGLGGFDGLVLGSVSR